MKNKYDGDNFLNLSYGVSPKKMVAKFAPKPKIIFLGYLGGYWVNLPLLSQLCQLYPSLDVYGGPPPPAHLKINYKGYAPSLDVIAEYQFGLVTISDDDLRKCSFSSKHLEYISYGLPVLTPAWRPDSVLESSSIYYTSGNFLQQLEHYGTKLNWQSKHVAALKSAEKLSWDNALKPLDFAEVEIT